MNVYTSKQKYCAGHHGHVFLYSTSIFHPINPHTMTLHSLYQVLIKYRKTHCYNQMLITGLHFGKSLGIDQITRFNIMKKDIQLLLLVG